MDILFTKSIKYTCRTTGLYRSTEYKQEASVPNTKLPYNVIKLKETPWDSSGYTVPTRYKLLKMKPVVYTCT